MLLPEVKALLRSTLLSYHLKVILGANADLWMQLPLIVKVGT